jgi:hypothetical protein
VFRWRRCLPVNHKTGLRAGEQDGCRQRVANRFQRSGPGKSAWEINLRRLRRWPFPSYGTLCPRKRWYP